MHTYIIAQRNWDPVLSAKPWKKCVSVEKRNIWMKIDKLDLCCFREYLKQLRRNRDCERDLMADVEGWEVGTYFGQPLYKTLGDDEIQQHMLRLVPITLIICRLKEEVFHSTEDVCNSDTLGNGQKVSL